MARSGVIGAKQKKEKTKNLKDAKTKNSLMHFVFLTTCHQSAIGHKKATRQVFLINSGTCPHDVIYIYYRECGYAHFTGWFFARLLQDVIRTHKWENEWLFITHFSGK